MMSIQRRLVLGSTFATAAVAVLGSIVLYVVVSGHLLQQFDETLAVKIDLIANSYELRVLLEKDLSDSERADAAFSLSGLLDDDSELPDEERTYIEIVDPEGLTIYRSATLDELESLNRFSGADLFELSGATPLRGAYERLLREYFDAEEQFPAYVDVFVARNATGLNEGLQDFRIVCLALAVGLVLTQAALLPILIRIGVKPVTDLSDAIQLLDESSLSSKLQTEVPRELSPVVDKLNGLLDRLQTAFDRERGFSNDVAHELRTPLAALKFKLELANSRERENADNRSIVAQCSKVAGEMETLINSLLLLGRMESGQVTISPTSVDIDSQVQTVWSQLERAAPSSKQHYEVHWQLAAKAELTTDAILLQRILTNILQNARDYVNEGGEITIATEEQDSKVRVVVENTGSQVCSNDEANVFSRFWRGDKSRSATGTHSGLGLAIAKRIAILLHSEISAKTKGDRFRITIILPRVLPEDTTS